MESSTYNREGSKLFAHYSQSRSENEKVHIKWTDVNYSILAKDPVKSTIISPVYKNKRILRNLNGTVRSGELLAIMGPTGTSTFQFC
jgi:ABC-type multidrug transport system fused ATPase/permease subunit